MKGSLPTATRTSDKANGSLFSRMANTTAVWTGTPFAFSTAFLIVVVWAVTGPIFNYSDTWQLVINTGTTIVTFLMVFLIQNTQNRDTKALQIKLAEIIVALEAANNLVATIEDATDEELERAHATIKNNAKR